MDLKTFIDKYQNQAENVNLRIEQPIVYDILEAKKQLLKNADFESERKDVFDFAQRAITDLKMKLLRAIRNKSYQHKYKGFTPPHILELKIYLEYRALWELSFSDFNKNKDIQEKQPNNHKALFHVISFILDCNANNNPLPTGKEWETAGDNRKKYTKSGNTFYKEANKILDKEFTKNMLSNLLGDNWRSIV